MSLKKFGAFCTIVIISGLCFLPACSSTKKKKEVRSVRMDPEGTVEEQLSYHQAQIKKYQAAAVKEDADAILYLSKHQMNEVRQANSRKFQYMLKVQEHIQAIEEIQAGL